MTPTPLTIAEKQEAPHHPAAFINTIWEEGTKEEACRYLQKTWDELCEARKLLALMQRDKGWRPIAEAPRDGRKVILYRPLAHLSNDPHVTIKRSISTPNHCWECTIPDGVDGLNYTDGACYATHWMPLPPPPHQPQGKEQP